MGEYIWQIAAGTGSRDYSKLFYDWGIATIGTGLNNAWNEKEYNENSGLGPTEKNMLKKFANDIKPGDYIILKIGKNIKAIGIVEEYKNGKAYFWNENFKYIDGWHLGHCVKVKWVKLENQKFKLSKKLSESRFCKYWADDKDIDKIKKTFESLKPISHKSLKDIEKLKLPEKLHEKNYENYLKPIFDNLQISNLKEFWEKISRLQEYTNSDIYNYSEEEVKIFFIIPILNALGWYNENIAVEHKNVDILLSYNGFTARDLDKEKENNNVNIIIESKRLDQGLVYAADQINKYLKNFKNIKYYILSNGIVSYIYKKNENSINSDPIACLDIENLWVEYLPYNHKIKGAIEFLKLMLNTKIKS